MKGEKGSSISWTDFNRLVPNGAWVRWYTGPTSIEGLVMRNETDEVNAPMIDSDKVLRITCTTAVDLQRRTADSVEYNLNGEWVDFRELCIRAMEQRLDQVRGTTAHIHPLQWMTHKEELNMTIEEIGAMLYETATWIEQAGNKGYSDNDLMKALPNLRIRLLGNAYRMAWENILFFSEGGNRRKHNRDFCGWGVHKYKPYHWKRTWMDRFGMTSPLADVLTDEIWDEAHAEHAKRSLKRANQTYASIDLEAASTRDIAHKAAVMWVMSRWAQRRAWSHWDTRDLWRLQARLYEEAYRVFEHELMYRQDGQPAPRRSKKQTQAARDDWATARLYFRPQIGFNAAHFYTPDYVEACCNSDAVPDLSVDFDHLPRGLQAQASSSVDNQDQAEV